jgi:phage antirepressor YoqD-like protein
LTVINESGLYSLVFSSKIKRAREFKYWVTSEVLPSIRKHGMYAAEEILENPDLAIQILQELKKEREEKKRLAAENAAQHEQIALMEPKADYFDDLVERNLLTNFRDTAKEFGMGQKQFIRWLMEHDYIYRDAHGKLMPYAAKNKGYFEVKEYRSEYNQNAGTQTLITPKGRETFRLLIWKE